MICLPASLERRLHELFPRAKDREAFVTNAVEEALQTTPATQTLPDHVGGTLHLFTDGGSRGNPGEAAIACVLEDPVSGTVLAEHFERIGQETNNVAEYRALIKGLELAQEFQPNRLRCHLDSELVVKQVNGEYRVKMPTLQPLVEEVQQRAQSLPDVVFVHIPRSDNHRADALVNRALDELPRPHTSSPARRIPPALFALLALCIAAPAHAAGDLLYRYDHFLFTVPASDIAGWTTDHTVWTYAGVDVAAPQALQADGDTPPAIPPGFATRTATSYAPDAIKESLRIRIAEQFDRPAGHVVIDRSASGAIFFEGVGLSGRHTDLDSLATLTIQALERGISDIEMPVEILPATVDVRNEELRALGIREVVTVGESTFAGSPVNRRHNIGVGLARFNGHLIEQGDTFSFNAVLGRVDGTTGYRKELVIKGDRTEPDYGGGLCQVSSTAYRGVWEYGFPIDQRTNHSYAVSYYGPQGTDATVYPPNPDMKFTNDSPGALLIQTYHDEEDHAYFIYYGTKDDRQSGVYGPLIWARVAPPPDRTLQTTDIPPGTRRKVGDRHPGMTAAWVRTVTMPDGDERREETVSIYQARPLFYEVGVLPEELTPDINTAEPTQSF